MKLTPPKVITFWIAVIIAVVGLLAQYAPIAALQPYGALIVFLGFALLALALLVKGL
jgi:hypothetical protein